jgi:energy-coupling factor transporter ATP-binding protein EcfA2
MAVWDGYPASYRANEVQRILRVVRAGECAAVLGLSGSGKSNLLGFLAGRGSEVAPGVDWVYCDCNRIPGRSGEGFFRLALGALGGETARSEAGLNELSAALDRRFQGDCPPLCLLLDRFDTLIDLGDARLFDNLRALRDDHKYRLTYVTASRCALPPDNELAELFFGHAFWLGSLSEADARWSATAYARRAGIAWDDSQVAVILTLSSRYPSFLRAICQAVSDGCAMEKEALRMHPAVRARLDEFRADAPTPEALVASGLAANPLLEAPPAAPGTAELTAKEKRLLDALQASPGQVCEKDALICAVWPEDQVYEQGLRDDSLAQLVRRLREKVEQDPAHPQKIVTVPGRGYRWTPRT